MGVDTTYRCIRRHNYGLIVGKFDGAGLTWGIIGFTLKHGELSEIVLEAFAKNSDWCEAYLPSTRARF
jgi:hypothetical protein